MATMWLLEMLHWIRLNKVPNDDLWDVVTTRMPGGVCCTNMDQLKDECNLGIGIPTMGLMASF